MLLDTRTTTTKNTIMVAMIITEAVNIITVAMIITEVVNIITEAMNSITEAVNIISLAAVAGITTNLITNKVAMEETTPGDSVAEDRTEATDKADLVTEVMAPVDHSNSSNITPPTKRAAAVI
jgi:hypothetical protein